MFSIVLVGQTMLLSVITGVNLLSIPGINHLFIHSNNVMSIESKNKLVAIASIEVFKCGTENMC